MKLQRLNKNELKTKNLVLITTSIITLLLGVSFFFSKSITFLDGNELFYVTMLLYFGLEFTNYLLTKEITGMHSLYIALACIIASVAGLIYKDNPTNIVISVSLIGWIIMMLIIKLIKIEDLRYKNNYSVFINIFTMSMFILLGFLTITNIFRGISNTGLMLGFFFVVNGVLNLIDTISNIIFCK